MLGYSAVTKKTTTEVPSFLRRTQGGLYTLPESLRKLCRDPSVEPDILTPMAQAQRLEITSAPCPECGGAVQEHYDPQNIFSDDEPLARAQGKCVDCDYTFDPRTGLVIETSKRWKVEEVLPIIESDED